jgi:hypothetical protein
MASRKPTDNDITTRIVMMCARSNAPLHRCTVTESMTMQLLPQNRPDIVAFKKQHVMDRVTKLITNALRDGKIAAHGLYLTAA